MANPRKFSEKIALQKQKQAEGTAEFERIMKEVYATKMDETQANQKILECCLVSSNNEVNVGSGIGNGGSTSSGVASGGASPEGSAGGGAGGCSSPTAYRESRGRSVGVGPMRRPSERKQDRSPYGSNATTVGAMGLANNGQNIAYLSPPMDTSWRRSNSDSALHQSLNIAVAAEGNMGPGGLGGLPGDLGALHASYQHHNQRSHSPNIGRSYSPQAQRRKGNMLQLQQQQQQQQQQHHQQQLQMHQQHQMQQQHQLQQQQHQQHHQQQQQQHHQQQQHQQQQQQQQQQHFNAKFYNCNIPANSLFKSLQEQAMAIANTGSLPDLTSVHYAAPAQQQMMQQQQQQQQQHPHPQQQQQTTLSPVLSPHHNQNSCGERDQSPSPFSPGGGGGNGGGPPSPYHQPQHSPTSAATTPVSVAQTSPHMSFTNLAVQSPCSPQQPAQTSGSSYGGHLPTLGAANSTGNLTDYRQPLNPPSPGSSPGLLTSVPGTELHSSAPSSPIRLPQSQTPLQQHMQQQQQGYNEKNIQNAFDRYSESAYNSLNPSFHNHFEQFSLGDGNSSPDQQLQQHFQQQQNNFAALDFEDFGGGGDVSGNSGPQQQHQSYSLAQNKLLNFNNLNALRGVERNATTSATSSNGDASSAATTTTCSNNNQQQQHSGRTLVNNQQQQQQLLNNNSSNRSTNVTPTTSCRDNNNANSLVQQQNDVSAAAASPAPQLSCLSSPSSPLPIPMPSHHHQQQQQQHALSLSHTHSAQHSPHHSPLHSPHHASPISASSPGLSTLGGSISPAASATTTAPTSNNQQSQSQQQHQHQHQQHQQQQQHHSNTTPTTTNIPSIIFSDYSSNSDFSREIFDTLDLDLGQMDVAGLQMLSDPSTIMIADPTIEDNFRRDLN